MITGAILTRDKDQAIETKGSFNIIDDSGATVWTTDSLELPNRDNAKGISCIPAGVYIVNKVPASHIHYPHFQLQNVPNRSAVCIHCGNIAALTNVEVQAGKHPDILGCIMVGTGYADINVDGIDDITGSRTAFDKLYAMMPDTFKLTIE